jgi:hypothetical protein
MSQATVFSASQWGLADEDTATGLVVASITWNGTSETAELPDHIGNSSGLAVYNPKKDVSGDGVISTKGTGLVGDIGDVLALANATNNTRTRNSEGLGVTPDAAAGVVITGNSISPQQTGFEGGGFTGIYLPGVSTTSPTILT